MSKINFYIASKLRHAPKWRELYRNQPEGFHMESRWPFIELDVKETEEDINRHAEHFWIDDVKDVRRSNLLILYVEPEDDINGALIEVGVALGSSVPVRIVGENPALRTWVNHPLISRYNSVEEALTL